MPTSSLAWEAVLQAAASYASPLPKVRISQVEGEQEPVSIPESEDIKFPHIKRPIIGIYFTSPPVSSEFYLFIYLFFETQRDRDLPPPAGSLPESQE